MTTKTHHPLIPDQQQGNSSDNEYSMSCASLQDAVHLFEAAKSRLLDVNNWQYFAEGISAEFALFTSDGQHSNGRAAIGAFLRIGIPGPRSKDGAGYDWVRVENIVEESDADKNTECFLMQVRPAPSPVSPGDETSHFFDDSATSNFLIEREGTMVKASVHGRNEKPNTESSNIIDTIRNAVTAITAIFGASDIQWKNLVKGLLHTTDK
jgi:hypothetical protein